ncbi:unnamed protein product [Closterium sp. NIES-53]
MELPPVTPEESHIVAHRSSSFTALRSLNKTLKAQRLSASNASPAPTRSSSMNNDKRSLPGKRKAMMVLFLAAVSISTIFVVKDLRFSGQSKQPQVEPTKRAGVLDDTGALMAIDSPSPAQTDGEDSLTGTGAANSESDIERLHSAVDQSSGLTDGSQNEQRPSFHTSVQNGLGQSMPAEEREGEREVAPDALGGENAASGEQDERREQGASGAQDESGGQGALGGTDVSRVQNGLEGQGAFLGQDAAKDEGVEIETEARVYELREKKRKKKRKEKKPKREKRPKKSRRGMGVRAPAPPPPPSPPPPPAQINPLDPVLSPSHPCANFTLPPPSTDRKRTGPRPCPVCYLPLPDAMAMRPPRGHTEEPILKHLAYVTEDDASERAARRAGNRPRFNGHQSLQQREDSFKIQESMRVHCGFVWGGKVSNGTGFDVSDDDRRFMERCYDIVVVSAIFGETAVRSVAWCGMVWHGVAQCGTVWHGVAWCGIVWHGVAWCGIVWHGVAWCGMVWHSVAQCGTVWHGVAWCGMVWHGVAWCGMVWHGVAWCGMVWHGVVLAVREHGEHGKWHGAYDVVQQPSNISEEARQQLCFVMFVDETTFNEFIPSLHPLSLLLPAHPHARASFPLPGAYDVVQQPSNVSEEARQQLCFVMFVDETTFNEFIRDGTLKQPRTRRVGLWRLVVVHNPPYRDPRRTGKIPKLLIHRLFPNVQFSMWVDAKLQLVQDPYIILERFLWRGNFSWAISKHYKRFDVFVEAEANKAAGKYRNASIDEQMEVYRSDGMTPFSEDKMPIISDVPEGCVIMREHTALSNLMACLWFNEVDRFTSRDQLSFGYTRDKICRSVPAWRLNMFLDCERRNFVVQGYHKDVLIQKLNGTSTAPARALSTATATPALTAAAAAAADGAGADAGAAGASGSFEAASGAATYSDPSSADASGAAASGDVFLREQQREEGSRQPLQQEGQGEKGETEEDGEEEQGRGRIERRLLGRGEREGGWEWEEEEGRRKLGFRGRESLWEERWKDVGLMSGLEGEGNGLT